MLDDVPLQATVADAVAELLSVEVKLPLALTLDDGLGCASQVSAMLCDADLVAVAVLAGVADVDAVLDAVDDAVNDAADFPVGGDVSVTEHERDAVGNAVFVLVTVAEQDAVEEEGRTTDAVARLTRYHLPFQVFPIGLPDHLPSFTSVYLCCKVSESQPLQNPLP